MDEIKELLTSWEEDGYINQGGLQSASEAIKLLVARVEELEAQVQALLS
jgi:hypothetical protein